MSKNTEDALWGTGRLQTGNCVKKSPVTNISEAQDVPLENVLRNAIIEF